MNDYQAKIGDLLRQAQGDSDGDVALLDEAVRIADLHGDVDNGMECRFKLIVAATSSGNHEMALVAYTWCLGQLDGNPELVPRWEWDVLWYFKWAVESLPRFPQISRGQIDGCMADMTDRYRRAGYGERPIYGCLADAAAFLGETEIFEINKALWFNSPRTGMSDCAACEKSREVEYVLREDIVRALSVAEPLIGGKLRCLSVPTTIFSDLLVPLLTIGENALAENLHRRSITKVLSGRKWLSNIGDHLLYLALMGNLPKAISVFETAMRWLVEFKRPWDRMVFAERSAAAFEMITNARDAPMKLRIPESAPLYRPDGIYKPSEVAGAMDRIRTELLEDFHRRNGNRGLDQRAVKLRELLAAVPRTSDAA